MADGGGAEAAHDGAGQGRSGDHLALPSRYDGRRVRLQVSPIPSRPQLQLRASAHAARLGFVTIRQMVPGFARISVNGLLYFVTSRVVHWQVVELGRAWVFVGFRSFQAIKE